MGCLSRLLGITIGLILLVVGLMGLVAGDLGIGLGLMFLGLLFLAASPKEKPAEIDSVGHRSFALTSQKTSQSVTPRSMLRTLGRCVMFVAGILIVLIGVAALSADIPKAVGWTVTAIGFVVFCVGVSIDPHATSNTTPSCVSDDEFEPPTEKQLKFAKRLGIEVPASMGKWELSATIDQALAENPEAQQQHETINRKRWEREIGAEAVRDIERWNNIADNQRFILAVYRSRGDTVVDVLDVHEADFVKQNVVLHVSAPKVTKMEGIRMLDFDRDFSLRLLDLLYHEELHSDFAMKVDDFREYEAAVKRGRKIAKRL